MVEEKDSHNGAWDKGDEGVWDRGDEGVWDIDDRPDVADPDKEFEELLHERDDVMADTMRLADKLGKDNDGKDKYSFESSDGKISISLLYDTDPSRTILQITDKKEKDSKEEIKTVKFEGDKVTFKHGGGKKFEKVASNEEDYTFVSNIMINALVKLHIDR